MRFGTSLFAALVLTGVLANVASAQTPANLGPYSVYGPGLTYRQDSSYRGPYYERFSSASSPAPTRTDTYSSLRSAALTTQTGPARVLGDSDTRPDAVRAPAVGSGPGAGHRRYVRLSISGNAIQAIVIP
jgi:hypothetical protein